MSQGMEHLNLKLGKNTEEGTLDAVPRSLSRQGRDSLKSAVGYDLWNAYEVSFLLPGGLPTVYHMQARYDAHSPNIVESKSFKLFLNAQNMVTFANLEAFSKEVGTALSQCVGSAVDLTFFGPEQSPERRSLEAVTLETTVKPSAVVSDYQPALLRALQGEGPFNYQCHLLRSFCPVTNQPDWGTVWIQGSGRRPCPEALLAYLISFRAHQDFHEACCETIYCDLTEAVAPASLRVSCFYTRRGGLDINPHRQTADLPLEETRRAPVWRQ